MSPASLPTFQLTLQKKILRINYSQVMSPLSCFFCIPKKSIVQIIFKKLLQLITEGMFIHNGKLFAQIDGVAMGNSLGTAFANWCLELIEKKF